MALLLVSFVLLAVVLLITKEILLRTRRRK